MAASYFLPFLQPINLPSLLNIIRGLLTQPLTAFGVPYPEHFLDCFSLLSQQHFLGRPHLAVTAVRALTLEL